MGTLIAGWLLCTVVATMVGNTKGRTRDGFLLGLVLGPVGLLIIVVTKPSIEVQVRREQELEDARARLRADAKKPAAPSSRDDGPRSLLPRNRQT